MPSRPVYRRHSDDLRARRMLRSRPEIDRGIRIGRVSACRQPGTGTEDQFLQYRAVHKVIGAWDAPGIGELYRVVDYPINDANPFIIPSPWGGPLSADSTERGNSSWRKQTAAGIILPIYRHLVPQRGWMWPAGRDGGFVVG